MPIYHHKTADKLPPTDGTYLECTALAHRLKDRVVAHVRMQRIDGPNGSVIVDQDQYERWMQGLEDSFTIYDGSDNPYVDALLAAWKQPSENSNQH